MLALNHAARKSLGNRVLKRNINSSKRHELAETIIDIKPVNLVNPYKEEEPSPNKISKDDQEILLSKKSNLLKPNATKKERPKTNAMSMSSFEFYKNQPKFKPCSEQSLQCTIINHTLIS